MQYNRIFFLTILLFCLFFSPFPSFAEAPAPVAAESMEMVPDLLGDDEFYEDGEDEWEDELAAPVGFTDPLEPVNRFFFVFNDKLYDWVLKPVADGYSFLLPHGVRQGIANFFTNLGAPVRLLSSVFQGNSDKSGVIVERFFINTTLGMLGFIDVAQSKFNLPPQKSDFGQTFGRWGFGGGPYFCLPLLGPSSLRDTVGMGVDIVVAPTKYIYEEWQGRVSLYSVETVNNLSLHPDLYDDLRRMTLDPYVAVRQAYYDYRSRLVEESKSQ